jgi:hypothetical protein
MSDWQVGDLAVCIDAEPRLGCPISSPLTAGAVYTITGLDPRAADDNEIGLYLAEISIPCVETRDCIWSDSFGEKRFRKSMNPLPEDPMRQHDRFIAAFCDDLFDLCVNGGHEMTRANRVAEITRQLRETRQQAVGDKL